MQFDLATARPLLARTPVLLNDMLRGLPDVWTTCNEGGESWSAFDIVGHLIHGDRTDWIPRVEHLLRFGEPEPFPPFDRFAQFQASKGRTLEQLLDTFADVREWSLNQLDSLKLSADDLERTGLHPSFGRVTLSQLLATWTVHDLDHIVQLSRVMARQYTDAVGPWREYLRVVRDV